MKKLNIKKPNKTVLMILICFSVAAIYALSVNFYMIGTASEYILTYDEAEEIENVDCILVLGAKVYGSELSHMLEDRVNTSIELYEREAAPKIIMSGDHGTEEYDEVNAMKAYAAEKGIPTEDIFMDHAGFSTYDSVYRAKNIFGAEKIIIVTQKYHLYRAIYAARYLGLDAYGVDAGLREYTLKTNIYNTAREFLARNKEFLFVKLDKESTYTGDKISLNGSGDITND